MHPVKKAAPAPVKTTAEVVSKPQLVAYQKIGDNSLVVKLTDKIIATLPLPSGKTSFTVAASSNNQLVALAKNTAADQEPAGFTVTSEGKITALPASVATTVNNSTTYTGANGFLDQKNNFLSIVCQTTTCTLTSLNLTTGATSPVISLGYTAPQNQSPATPSTSMALLGIDQHDISYMQNYSQSNIADPIGTLVSVDLASGSTTRSFSMPQAATHTPTFSPNFAHALFTQSQDNATGNLIDWSSSKTSQVSGSIGNGPNYLWSPDSKRALFLNNPHNQTNTLGIITTTSIAQTILKTFPVSPTVMVTILGWVDTSHIQYEISTTKTANDFAAAANEIHILDVDSGDDKVIGIPEDLELIPVNGQSLATSS